MAYFRSPIIGIILVGGIAVAAAIFGLLNWRWLKQQRLLEHDGIAAVAQIDAVTISHKACNSRVQLRWKDAQGATHAGRFMTCFANRSEGETVPIRYLKTEPANAMIAPDEGGLPDSQYQTGAIIGAVISATMTAALASLTARRQKDVARDRTS